MDRANDGHRSKMYRFGGQWIVQQWDASVRCYRESEPVDFWTARAAVGRDNCGRKGCTNPNHYHDLATEGGRP